MGLKSRAESSNLLDFGTKRYISRSDAVESCCRYPNGRAFGAQAPTLNTHHFLPVEVRGSLSGDETSATHNVTQGNAST
jgi:hypothetical protein